MIGRGNRDDIQILVLERLADVLKTLRRIAALLSNLPAPRLEQASIWINQVSDLNIFLVEILIDMGVALPVNAGDANANHLIRAEHSPGGFRAGNGKERIGRADPNGLLNGSPEKTPTGDVHEL